MKLSLELAYILGVLFGDGYIFIARRENRSKIKHCCIALQAKDKEFVQSFANCLNKEFNLNLQVKPLPKKYKGEILHYFQVYLYSRKIAQYLLETKLRVFDYLLDADEDIICQFLKGLYDSEGSVSLRRNKTRSIKLSMKSSTYFFERVSKLLELIGVHGFKYYNLSKFNSIEIGNKKDLFTFQEKIGFTITRKQEILKGIVQSYPTGLAMIREQSRGSLDITKF